MTTSLVLASHTDELIKLSMWLEAYIPKIFTTTQKNNILLLAQELVTNAITHGNNNIVKKKITIIVEELTNQFILSIEDESSSIITLPTKEEAQEMDYLAENGRGLKLAVMLSDEIYTENQKITLIFNKG